MHPAIKREIIALMMSEREKIDLILETWNKQDIPVFIFKKDYYFDLPHVFNFTSSIEKAAKHYRKIGYEYRERRAHLSHGSSFFSPESALLKCLSEGVERFSLSCWPKKAVVRSTFNKLTQALNPTEYIPDEKLKKTTFTWVKGHDLIKNTPAYVPLHLVYFNTMKKHKEPLLADSISTGASGGFDRDEVTLRSLYEVIERDAFMTMYLNKIPALAIDLKYVKNKEVADLVSYCRRYFFEPHVFDMTNDLGVPSYLCVLQSMKKDELFFALGAKTSFEQGTAFLGAIQEALTFLPWLRGLFSDENKLKNTPKNIYAIRSLEERALVWDTSVFNKELAFLMNQKKRKVEIKFTHHSISEQLKKTLYALKKKKKKAYLVNLTLPEFDKAGHFVHKAIIPGLQPLYLYEDQREWNDARLQEVATFFNKKVTAYNNFPHPFL